MQAGCGGGAGLHERILHLVRDTITVVGADGRVRFVNERPAEGGSSSAVGQSAITYVHPDDQALALERRAHLLSGHTTTTVLRVRVGDGDWRHVETHGVNLLDDPQVQGLLYISRDVEDREQAERSLRHALRAQRAVADLGVRALQSAGTEGVVQEGLELVRTILGTPSATLLLLDTQRRLRVRLQCGPDPLPVGHLWAGGGADVDAEVPLEGLEGPIGLLTTSAPDPRGLGPTDRQLLQGVANVLAGALQREQRERSAVVQALHDPLTGLPARTLFTDRLGHELSRIRRTGGSLAVLLIDLDRFKAVNDAFGHAAGDAVLRTLGPRLAAGTRASDTVARYGGDEFVVLCEDDATPLDVERVATAIRAACAEPVQLPSGDSVLLSASIGIAWSDSEGADADALLAAADVAMYRDKRSDVESV